MSAQSLRSQVAQAGRIFEMMMGVRPDRAPNFMPPAPRALHLGVSSSLPCEHARQAIERFGAIAPDIPILISALPSEEIAHRVKQGDLDVGLLRHEVAPEGCRVETLWREAALVYSVVWRDKTPHAGIAPFLQALHEAADRPATPR